MPFLDNFFDRRLDIHIPIIVMDLLGLIFSFGVVFLAGIWCIYYSYHAVVVKRVIKSLNNSTEHDHRERYTNAVIEYKKSIFIVIICVTESWLHVFYWGIVSETFIYFHTKDKRQGWNYLLKKNPSFDFLMTVTFSLFILMGSLVSILTAYLIKAYGTERETKLNEKQLFVWMFLQLLIGWVLCPIPTLHFTILPIYILSVFIGQIAVYIRLSRRLYSVLRKRREDAYFENREWHAKLVRMCKNFKYGAIAYTVVLMLFLSNLTAMIVKRLYIAIFIRDKFLFGYLDAAWIFDDTPHSTLRFLKISLILLCKLIAMLMLFFSLTVHLSIIATAVVRAHRRRRRIRRELRCVHDLLRIPLIGEN